MKKGMLKKKALIIGVAVCASSMLMVSNVWAKDITKDIGKIEYSEEFQEYLNLSDEEKAKTIEPRGYKVINTKQSFSNPFKVRTLVGSAIDSNYSLKDTIPSNVVVHDQKSTNTCWAFAIMSSLETNMALKNVGSLKVYDFSERHMDYSTTREFLNGKVNSNGFNRNIKSGGTFDMASAYLTNGMGAVSESSMPFENNEDIIDISKIQNKTVASEVYDTVDFPASSVTDDLTQLKQNMKNHIKQYGAISAYIHGSQLFTDYYDNDTGALYCDDETNCPINHGVSIVGWIDNYDVNNFNSKHRPTNPGAWIIKNSWGEKMEYSVSEMKQTIFTTYRDMCIQNGWADANSIPDTFITSLGYTINGDVASIEVGDKGFMYVSYEDVNVYKNLFGISNSANSTDYDNIYQYNMYGVDGTLPLGQSDIYVGNIFTKQTTNNEEISQVGINVSETSTCKVFVNPNGTSMASADLQSVSLKAGNSETFGAGYHTLEFLNPVEIKANNFAVVVEITGTRQNQMDLSVEANIVNSMYDQVVVANSKCFMTYGEYFDDNQWIDLSKMSDDISGATDVNSSLKVFTVNQVEEVKLNSIQITTAPTKTSYIEGQNFDKTGMAIKANYSDGQSNVITDYNITNGSNLAYGQNSVTISYQDKTITQAITVEKNSVVSISITTASSKLTYKAGENFDKTGMVVKATYKDGSIKEVTGYIIDNGENLKNGQVSVNVSYEGKVIAQNITVQSNEVTNLEIITAPSKVNYVVGQDFDKTGMVIKATYEDGSSKEISGYTITNGTGLTASQTYVTISFDGKSVNQTISVVDKTVVSIQVSTMPTKIKYVQGRDSLNLAGGYISVTYNDNTSDSILMTSSGVTAEGFSNEIVGQKSITLTYQGKTTLFQVEVIAESNNDDDDNDDVVEQPVNSNFNFVNSSVKKIVSYTYTNSSNKDYELIKIELSGINKNLGNDSCEYYYYLSSNPDEEDISGWTKIDNMQDASENLEFTIDTKNVENFNELASSDNLYLYVKEVAIKGGNQQVAISNAMEVNAENVEIDTYVDGVKQEDIINNNGDDETTAPGILPQTGVKYTIVICIAICGCICAFILIRNKRLNDRHIRK